MTMDVLASISLANWFVIAGVVLLGVLSLRVIRTFERAREDLESDLRTVGVRVDALLDEVRDLSARGGALKLTVEGQEQKLVVLEGKITGLDGVGRVTGTSNQDASDMRGRQADSDLQRDRLDLDRYRSVPPKEEPPTGYTRAKRSGAAVDFNGKEVRPSEALESVGLLLTDDTPTGAAELYLNESVAINSVAFDRWELLFDFRGGGAHKRFRTVKPSLIEWDATAQRGALKSKGVAEALP